MIKVLKGSSEPTLQCTTELQKEKGVGTIKPCYANKQTLLTKYVGWLNRSYNPTLAGYTIAYGSNTRKNKLWTYIYYFSVTVCTQFKGSPPATVLDTFIDTHSTCAL